MQNMVAAFFAKARDVAPGKIMQPNRSPSLGAPRKPENFYRKRISVV
jgi:hypothetical protein